MGDVLCGRCGSELPVALLEIDCLNEEVKALTLALSEYKILLTASAKREREGVELLEYVNHSMCNGGVLKMYKKVRKFLGVKQ